MKSNDARNQSGSERSPASTDDQPDTAAHTITGDGTIPADATVETRDSGIADTVKDDADSHACEGCGQTFEEIGRLLDHDCEEDWGGPDPDDDGRRARADGGVPGEEQCTAQQDSEYVHPRDRDVDGTLILADERARNLEWHHATEYTDGAFQTACGRAVVPDDVRDELQNPAEDWWRNVTPTDGCPKCRPSALGEEEPVAMTDGGEPSEARRSSSELRSDGGLTRMEDVDPPSTPERSYHKSPQVRKDILAEIVRLNEQHDTVRYSDVRSEDAPQSVRALAFETFLQHATILAMEDLIERGAFHETQTTVKPTEAAVEIVGDRDE